MHDIRLTCPDVCCFYGFLHMHAEYSGMLVCQREHVSLLKDNRHRVSWLVLLPGGVEVIVPSVCYIILPPNKHAINISNRLQEMLTETKIYWIKCNTGLNTILLWYLLHEKMSLVTSWTIEEVEQQHHNDLQKVMDKVEKLYNKLLESRGESSILQTWHYEQMNEDMSTCRRIYENLIVSLGQTNSIPRAWRERSLRLSIERRSQSSSTSMSPEPLSFWDKSARLHSPLSIEGRMFQRAGTLPASRELSPTTHYRGKSSPKYTSDDDVFSPEPPHKLVRNSLTPTARSGQDQWKVPTNLDTVSLSTDQMKDMIETLQFQRQAAVQGSEGDLATADQCASNLKQMPEERSDGVVVEPGLNNEAWEEEQLHKKDTHLSNEEERMKAQLEILQESVEKARAGQERAETEAALHQAQSDELHQKILQVENKVQKLEASERDALESRQEALQEAERLQQEAEMAYRRDHLGKGQVEHENQAEAVKLQEEVKQTRMEVAQFEAQLRQQLERAAKYQELAQQEARAKEIAQAEAMSLWRSAEKEAELRKAAEVKVQELRVVVTREMERYRFAAHEAEEAQGKLQEELCKLHLAVKSTSREKATLEEQQIALKADVSHMRIEKDQTMAELCLLKSKMEAMMKQGPKESSFCEDFSDELLQKEVEQPSIWTVKREVAFTPPRQEKETEHTFPITITTHPESTSIPPCPDQGHSLKPPYLDQGFSLEPPYPDEKLSPKPQGPDQELSRKPPYLDQGFSLEPLYPDEKLSPKPQGPDQELSLKPPYLDQGFSLEPPYPDEKLSPKPQGPDQELSRKPPYLDQGSSLEPPYPNEKPSLKSQCPDQELSRKPPYLDEGFSLEPPCSNQELSLKPPYSDKELSLKRPCPDQELSLKPPCPDKGLCLKYSRMNSIENLSGSTTRSSQDDIPAFTSIDGHNKVNDLPEVQKVGRCDIFAHDKMAMEHVEMKEYKEQAEQSGERTVSLHQELVDNGLKLNTYKTSHMSSQRLSSTPSQAVDVMCCITNSKISENNDQHVACRKLETCDQNADDWHIRPCLQEGLENEYNERHFETDEDSLRDIMQSDQEACGDVTKEKESLACTSKRTKEQGMRFNYESVEEGNDRIVHISHGNTDYNDVKDNLKASAKRSSGSLLEDGSRWEETNLETLNIHPVDKMKFDKRVQSTKDEENDDAPLMSSQTISNSPKASTEVLGNSTTHSLYDDEKENVSSRNDMGTVETDERNKTSLHKKTQLDENTAPQKPVSQEKHSENEVITFTLPNEGKTLNNGIQQIRGDMEFDNLSNVTNQSSRTLEDKELCHQIKGVYRDIIVNKYKQQSNSFTFICKSGKQQKGNLGEPQIEELSETSLSQTGSSDAVADEDTKVVDEKIQNLRLGGSDSSDHLQDKDNKESNVDYAALPNVKYHKGGKSHLRDDPGKGEFKDAFERKSMLCEYQESFITQRRENSINLPREPKCEVDCDVRVFKGLQRNEVMAINEIAEDNKDEKVGTLIEIPPDDEGKEQVFSAEEKTSHTSIYEKTGMRTHVYAGERMHNLEQASEGDAEIFTEPGAHLKMSTMEGETVDVDIQEKKLHQMQYKLGGTDRTNGHPREEEEKTPSRELQTGLNSENNMDLCQGDHKNKETSVEHTIRDDDETKVYSSNDIKPKMKKSFPIVVYEDLICSKAETYYSTGEDSVPSDDVFVSSKQENSNGVPGFTSFEKDNFLNEQAHASHVMSDQVHGEVRGKNEHFKGNAGMYEDSLVQISLDDVSRNKERISFHDYEHQQSMDKDRGGTSVSGTVVETSMLNEGKSHYFHGIQKFKWDEPSFEKQLDGLKAPKGNEHVVLEEFDRGTPMEERQLTSSVKEADSSVELRSRSSDKEGDFGVEPRSTSPNKERGSGVEPRSIASDKEADLGVEPRCTSSDKEGDSGMEPRSISSNKEGDFGVEQRSTSSDKRGDSGVETTFTSFDKEGDSGVKPRTTSSDKEGDSGMEPISILSHMEEDFVVEPRSTSSENEQDSGVEPRSSSSEMEGDLVVEPRYRSSDKNGHSSMESRSISYDKEGDSGVEPRYTSSDKGGDSDVEPRSTLCGKEGDFGVEPISRSSDKERDSGVDHRSTSSAKEGDSGVEPRTTPSDKGGDSGMEPRSTSSNKEGDFGVEPRYMSSNKEGDVGVEPRYMSSNKEGDFGVEPRSPSSDMERDSGLEPISIRSDKEGDFGVEPRSTSSDNEGDSGVELRSMSSNKGGDSGMESRSTSSNKEGDFDVEPRSTSSDKERYSGAEPRSTASDKEGDFGVEPRSISSDKARYSGIETRYMSSHKKGDFVVEPRSTSSDTEGDSGVQLRSRSSDKEGDSDMEPRSMSSNKEGDFDVEPRSTSSDKERYSGAEPRSTASDKEGDFGVEPRSISSDKARYSGIETRYMSSHNKEDFVVEPRSTSSDTEGDSGVQLRSRSSDKEGDSGMELRSRSSNKEGDSGVEPRSPSSDKEGDLGVEPRSTSSNMEGDFTVEPRFTSSDKERHSGVELGFWSSDKDGDSGMEPRSISSNKEGDFGVEPRSISSDKVRYSGIETRYMSSHKKGDFVVEPRSTSSDTEGDLGVQLRSRSSDKEGDSGMELRSRSSNKERDADVEPRSAASDKEGDLGVEPRSTSSNMEGDFTVEPKSTSSDKERHSGVELGFWSSDKDGDSGMEPRSISSNKEGDSGVEPRSMSSNKEGDFSVEPRSTSSDKERHSGMETRYMSSHKEGDFVVEPRSTSSDKERHSGVEPRSMSSNKEGDSDVEPRPTSSDKEGDPGVEPTFTSFDKNGDSGVKPRSISSNKERDSGVKARSISSDKEGDSGVDHRSISSDKEGDSGVKPRTASSNKDGNFGVDPRSTSSDKERHSGMETRYLSSHKEGGVVVEPRSTSSHNGDSGVELRSRSSHKEVDSSVERRSTLSGKEGDPGMEPRSTSSGKEGDSGVEPRFRSSDKEGVSFVEPKSTSSVKGRDSGVEPISSASDKEGDSGVESTFTSSDKEGDSGVEARCTSSDKEGGSGVEPISNLSVTDAETGVTNHFTLGHTHEISVTQIPQHDNMRNIAFSLQEERETEIGEDSEQQVDYCDEKGKLVTHKGKQEFTYEERVTASNSSSRMHRFQSTEEPVRIMKEDQETSSESTRHHDENGPSEQVKGTSSIRLESQDLSNDVTSWPITDGAQSDNLTFPGHIQEIKSTGSTKAQRKAEVSSVVAYSPEGMNAALGNPVEQEVQSHHTVTRHENYLHERDDDDTRKRPLNDQQILYHNTSRSFVKLGEDSDSDITDASKSSKSYSKSHVREGIERCFLEGVSVQVRKTESIFQAVSSEVVDKPDISKEPLIPSSDLLHGKGEIMGPDESETVVDKTGVFVAAKGLAAIIIEDPSRNHGAAMSEESPLTAPNQLEDRKNPWDSPEPEEGTETQTRVMNGVEPRRELDLERLADDVIGITGYAPNTCLVMGTLTHDTKELHVQAKKSQQLTSYVSHTSRDGKLLMHSYNTATPIKIGSDSLGTPDNRCTYSEEMVFESHVDTHPFSHQEECSNVEEMVHGKARTVIGEYSESPHPPSDDGRATTLARNENKLSTNSLQGDQNSSFMVDFGAENNLYEFNEKAGERKETEEPKITACVESHPKRKDEEKLTNKSEAILTQNERKSQQAEIKGTFLTLSEDEDDSVSRCSLSPGVEQEKSFHESKMVDIELQKGSTPSSSLAFSTEATSRASIAANNVETPPGNTGNNWCSQKGLDALPSEGIVEVNENNYRKNADALSRSNSYGNVDGSPDSSRVAHRGHNPAHSAQHTMSLIQQSNKIGKSWKTGSLDRDEKTEYSAKGRLIGNKLNKESLQSVVHRERSSTLLEEKCPNPDFTSREKHEARSEDTRGSFEVPREANGRYVQEEISRIKAEIANIFCNVDQSTQTNTSLCENISKQGRGISPGPLIQSKTNELTTRKACRPEVFTNTSFGMHGSHEAYLKVVGKRPQESYSQGTGMSTFASSDKVLEKSTSQTHPSEVIFQGLRAPISIHQLESSHLIDRTTAEQLREGRLSPGKISLQLSSYLKGSRVIAGLIIEKTRECLSVHEAMRRKVVRPGCALQLLEAQAATGFIIEPISGRKLSVTRATWLGIVAPEFYEKLLSAEGAVTGYFNPKTNEHVSLFEALRLGIILPSHGMRLLEAQLATGGLIDPAASHRLPLSVALARGLIDPEVHCSLCDPYNDCKGFFDPNTDENLTYAELQERCVRDYTHNLLLLPLHSNRTTESFVIHPRRPIHKGLQSFSSKCIDKAGSRNSLLQSYSRMKDKGSKGSLPG
uniref:uncharacterized protein n=1 Tax=Myxine glutinosa TaxID=7769 RepID=UPI00358FFEF3